MNVRLKTAPVIYPVSTTDIKEPYLRETVVDTGVDALILSLIKTETNWVEKYTGRQLMTATYEIISDRFFYPKLDLPYIPIQSVTSIKYYDTDNVEQTWAASNYYVYTSDDWGYIEILPNITIPSLYDRPDAVTIEYVAGYGADASTVPDIFKTAIKQRVGNLYEFRQDGQSKPGIAKSELMLFPYRVFQ